MIKTLITLACVQLLALFSFGAETPGCLDVSYYDKVRFDYTARKDFSAGWDMGDDRKAIIDALKAGDFDKSKKLGDAWLNKVPVDTEIYLVIALGRKAKGDLAGYARYMANFYGFLSSITSSGDGLSAKTAFKVISVSEEYSLLRDIDAKVKKQSLQGSCDVMLVEQRGKEMTYYFDATIPLEAERKELGLK